MDNQYHTAKEVAAINNRDEIVQFLDHIIAQQSALNTKFVQKMKEKALNEAEKRIKMFQKMQNKTIKMAEREERQREKNRKKSLCIVKSTATSSSSSTMEMDVDSTTTETTIIDDQPQHIYDQLTIGNGCERQYHSTISSNSSSSTMKFSDIVNSSIKSSTSKSGTARMKILAGVSRKVLVRKSNSNDTVKSNENDGNGCRTMVRSLVGIRRDDQIMYVPKYGSLSVTNLSLTGTNDMNGIDETSKPNVNDRLHLKDMFDVNDTSTSRTGTETKMNTFNKNIKTSIKSRLLRLNHKIGNHNGSHKHKSNHNNVTLYRTISEPDFMFAHDNIGKSAMVGNCINDVSIANDDCRHSESASIFERPGFGSVSFRGKFTPESLFFMPRYYQVDSLGNSDDDADSGHHEHSQNGSTYSERIKKYCTDKISNSMTPDRDSFASDSIGSAGSLVQPDCLDDQYETNAEQCLPESKSIPVLLFLYAHGLKEYYDLFEREKIDIDSLMLLNEQDFISLGIALGPRRKLINAIRQRRLLLDSDGHVFETRL